MQISVVRFQRETSWSRIFDCITHPSAVQSDLNFNFKCQFYGYNLNLKDRKEEKDV